jgi:hypothetical protein
VIGFLRGVFSVLGVRAEKIVKTLEDKKDIPLSATEHCRRVSERTKGVIVLINDRQDILRELEKSLQTGIINSSQSDSLLKQILKSYRSFRREIDVIEENFVGHLIRFNEADLFYTNLSSALWKDTNLPDTAPVAVTNTSGYFCTWASLGIVFSPPSSEHHLLISPDLYHEFGHILHEGLKIQLFGKRFEAELKSHITDLKNKVRRNSRPIEDKTILEIAFRWKSGWAEEVACDTLSTLMLGPAYGWCNFHLCLQNHNIFDFAGQHPSDAARTKHILAVLRRLGFREDADKIENLWSDYIRISQPNNSKYYQDYHPESLFTAVLEDVEESIKANNFGVTGKSPVIEKLNKAWKQFLDNTANYNDWEIAAIIEIKEEFAP